MKVLDIGRTGYADALAIQQSIHQEVQEETSDDVLILCEHSHVYTFGKSADHTNLLIQPAFLEKIGAEVHQTDRGGDITYHGPGQLVGYPIITLRKHRIGVKKYVDLLEAALIESLAQLQITAYQIDGLVGIWVGEEHEIKRKIGAIGIRVKEGVSMHGFALNVNTDLSYFNHIVPCGITDKTVTSIFEERKQDCWSSFKALFVEAFESKLELAAINQ